MTHTILTIPTSARSRATLDGGPCDGASIASLDDAELRRATGGAGRLFQPKAMARVASAFYYLGAPIRALGVFAPNTVRLFGEAAKDRHDGYVRLKHPNNPSAQIAHDTWLRAFYGQYSPI